MLTDKWQDALPLVRSPARYTDGEWNAYRKAMDRAAARVVFVYPDAYEAGVCDYGLAVLYGILNNHPDYAADRAYLPWPDMRRAMRSRGLQLGGLESGWPLKGFDVIGISLPHPLCFTAAPVVLALAGLPLRAVDRGQPDPTVIAGGAAAVNPEPVAEFFDAILLGEGEEAVQQVMESVAQNRGQDREARQRALAAIEGVYVPAVHGPSCAEQATAVVTSRVVEDLSKAPVPERPLVPFVEALGECASVEVSRGCACGWQFCPARHVSGAARRRAPQSVAESAWRSVRSTGYDQVALFGVDGCDGEGLAKTMAACLEALRDESVSISLPVMRAPLIHDVCEYVNGKPVDLDVGPASDRLRATMAMEPLPAIIRVIEEAVEAGARTIRLRLLIGLPGETDDDVRAMADFINQAARVAQGSASRAHSARMAAHVAAFVPQPQTPAQWFGSASPEALLRRLSLLKESVSQRHVRLHLPDPNMAQLSAALARGGREVAQSLIAGSEAGLQPISAAMDASAAPWLKCLADCGQDASHYANRDIPLEQNLPWQHLRFASSSGDLRSLAGRILRSG